MHSTLTHEAYSAATAGFAPKASEPAELAVSDESPQRILYVTPEIADYVKAGGLGEVSAALPRTLRQEYDVRVLVPGYRQILDNKDQISVVARMRGVRGMPGCEIGRMEAPDGLIVYVVLCPELYDREGSPYGNSAGLDWADNDLRFARLSL